MIPVALIYVLEKGPNVEDRMMEQKPRKKILVTQIVKAVSLVIGVNGQSVRQRSVKTEGNLPALVTSRNGE